MFSPQPSRTIASIVLAWFMVVVGLGTMAPSIQPHRLDIVCSGSGDGAHVVDLGAPAGDVALSHALDCPLCLPFGAAVPQPDAASPPAPGDVTLVRGAGATALTSFTAAAALPARGPPSFV